MAADGIREKQPMQWHQSEQKRLKKCRNVKISIAENKNSFC